MFYNMLNPLNPFNIATNRFGCQRTQFRAVAVGFGSVVLIGSGGGVAHSGYWALEIKARI